MQMFYQRRFLLQRDNEEQITPAYYVVWRKCVMCRTVLVKLQQKNNTILHITQLLSTYFDFRNDNFC
jgi:hypothetical protein